MNTTHHISSTGIKDARKKTLISKSMRMKKSTLRFFISLDMEKEKKESLISKFMRMYAWSVECKGTNYYKVFILGHTGIYYAHPDYGHADYNKCRVCNITPYTKRLMNHFNNLLN